MGHEVLYATICSYLLQHIYAVQYAAIYYYIMLDTAVHCYLLLHTATYCSIPQYTMQCFAHILLHNVYLRGMPPTWR